MSKAFPWFESIDIMHRPHGEDRVPERRQKKDARISKTATRELAQLATLPIRPPEERDSRTWV
jgi:hypothetical protein